MDKKDILDKLRSNWIVRNIFLGFIMIFGLSLSAQLLLTCITKHNRTIAVPDFYGMTVAEASKAARKAGMRVDVTDSIYVKRMQAGAVVRQEPKPGSTVKDGRRILLTINAVTPKQIPMPDLIGSSLRSANAELVARGLEAGKLIYVSDIATNNVISQLYNNSPVKAGKMIPEESEIDLVLGLNPEDNLTSAPNLSGMKYRNAMDCIHNSSLNVGVVLFDRGISTYADSLNAVVYRQSPPAGTSGLMMGRTVSIYLTLDEEKLTVQEGND